MKNVTTCNLSSWGKNAWKKSGLSGFEPGPLRSWYSTLTNYAVAKACLHFHQILKKFEVMPFLDNFFCYYFILLTSFLFISHSLLGLVEKINEFHPLAPRDLVKRGRKMYIHDGMFYHAKDQFYPVVRIKTQAAISAQVFIQECSHNLQHIVRWPGRNWTVCLLQQCHFSNTLYRHWEKLLPENINTIKTTLDYSSGCCQYNMLELLKL